MNKSFRVIKHLLLLVFLFFIMYPVITVIINSFKDNNELYRNIFGLPENWYFSNYYNAWVGGKLYVFYKNSAVVSFISVLFCTLFSTFAAFALTRRNMIFRNILYAAFVVGVMVPYHVGLLPLYMLLGKMKLVDSLTGLILVNIAYGMPFAIFILVGFFKTINREIEESAFIEGCSNFRLYSSIIMPLSPTVIATVTIFRLVWFWNDMLYPMVFIRSKDLKTLPVGLLSFKGEYITQYGTLFAGVVIVSVPVIVIYLALQRYFIEGVTAGAVKG